ncbi:PREDICTED: uncharacterized protein LOC105564045 [Vollenhovia emeryi]|uniref:uncharacterized protein LOC105564045 n=1 Tax=Vollenhovia emeryi TaxID=411798 RepID=UPI0005F3A07A|nr:PREDICTED: uncharacterized protein LOC105564045 [Vollenhovia emeryi]
MSHDEDSQKWMKDVTSGIIKNLGLDIEKVRYKVSEPTKKFTSTIYYILLQFENKTKEQNKELSVIVKKVLQTFSPILRIDLQFHNEILFYQMYTRPDENYPRCLYVDERPPADAVIALENVNKRGYYPCSYKCNVSLEYTLAAMRELGRFHGKGYAMKTLQRDKFFDIVTRIEEVRYCGTEQTTENKFEIICNSNSTRAIEYLRNHGHDTVFCDKMEALLSNAFNEVMMKTVKPLEPLSTLCHGDFTLDNIFFKTEDDGQYRAMLIDFALFRYSTPVVDLSTFFCLCCSNEMTKDKFFEIMRVYHDALKEYLLEAGVWDMEKYSYEALLDDYRRGGLFGFVIATFFLPVILGFHKSEIVLSDMLRFDALERMKRKKYDDEMCKILADMLLNLRDFGCLKHIL